MMPLPHDVDIGWPSDPKLFRYGCICASEKLLREDFCVALYWRLDSMVWIFVFGASLLHNKNS